MAYLLTRSEPENEDHPQHPILIRYVGLAAACCYVFALDCCFSFIAPFTETEPVANRYYIMLWLLTILPPIYFFVEATYFYGKDFGKCDNLKHSQELASRVWAAMTLLLTFYWFHAKA
jgi:hypothetical protein